MNDLGELAEQIINTEFPEDTDRFPISYVSGWLDANIGEVNILLNEDFEIDVSGNFLPSFCAEEEAIYTELYSVHYYEKLSRDVLRGITSNCAGSSDWVLLKEGDTTIQKQNKNSIARTLNSFKNDSMDKLNDLVSKYNVYKSSPIQVYGSDKNNIA
jgi:hypothetical protein